MTDQIQQTNGNGEKPNFYALFQKVGSIDGKLDEALKTMREQDRRLNSVEKDTDNMIGKASILGGIAGFIGAIFVTIIGYFLPNK